MRVHTLADMKLLQDEGDTVLTCTLTCPDVLDEDHKPPHWFAKLGHSSLPHFLPVKANEPYKRKIQLRMAFAYQATGKLYGTK